MSFHKCVSLVSVQLKHCVLVLQMKTGPFAEHSNQLWNISAVPSWSKVNQGLIRMYKAEVCLLHSVSLSLMSQTLVINTISLCRKSSKLTALSNIKIYFFFYSKCFVCIYILATVAMCAFTSI